MDIIGQDKPSLEDALQHFGVRGMKWGIRKGVGPEIRRARLNVANASSDIRAQKKIVRKTTDRGTAERAAGKKKVADMEMALLNNPDRATAMRMTRGEKATVLALNVVNPIGFASAAAVIGARSVASRVIAKKQKSGAYNK